jgi:protein-S-isoprenylcysteine O-methyltransferase Ste14
MAGERGIPREDGSRMTQQPLVEQEYVMSRAFVLAYGIVCYVLFLGSFLALVAYLSGIAPDAWFPRIGAASRPMAVAIDVALVALFGVQHSVMARPWFKRAIQRFVPPPIERSTYVLMTVVAIAVLLLFWQPLPTTVWHTEGLAAIALRSAFVAGVLLVLIATFLIDHFELFGLAQVVAFARGRAHRPPTFRLNPLHARVRHPLYVGWLITFFATPSMTVDHLVFAVAMAAYILIAIVHEERDLVAIHGSIYERYRAAVPMLVPSLRPRVMRDV